MTAVAWLALTGFDESRLGSARRQKSHITKFLIGFYFPFYRILVFHSNKKQIALDVISILLWAYLLRTHCTQILEF